MCQSMSQGGNRCAAETGGKCEDARGKYFDAHPNGPPVDPVSSVEIRSAAQAASVQHLPGVIKPPRDSHAVWLIHPDGRIELYGAYKTTEEQWAARTEAKDEATGAHVVTRPGSFTSRDIEEVAVRHQIAAERAGEGPNPRRTSDHMTCKDAPPAVEDATYLIGLKGPFPLEHDEGGGVWGTYGQEQVLAPSAELHTSQLWVSGTHIKSLVERMGEGDDVYVRGQDNHFSELPSVYEHSDGSLWVLDGHHAIMAARDRGRSVKVMVMSHTDMPNVRAWVAECDEDDEEW